MFKKILVPLDGSDLAAKVIPQAVDLAKSFNAQLILMPVGSAEVGVVGLQIRWERCLIKSASCSGEPGARSHKRRDNRYSIITLPPPIWDKSIAHRGSMKANIEDYLTHHLTKQELSLVKSSAPPAQSGG